MPYNVPVNANDFSVHGNSDYFGKANQFGSQYLQTAGSPVRSVFDSPQFAEILKLLAPGGKGQNQMMDIGIGKINQQAQAGSASALTNILSRNMEGSSLENNALQGVEAARMQAIATLMQGLLGQQQQQGGQLANLMFQGIGSDNSLYENRMSQILDFYRNAFESAGNLGALDRDIYTTRDLAAQKRESDMWSSLISAGGSIGSAMLY